MPEVQGVAESSGCSVLYLWGLVLWAGSWGPCPHHGRCCYGMLASPPNSYPEALAASTAVLGDEISKEVIQVKMRSQGRGPKLIGLVSLCDTRELALSLSPLLHFPTPSAL